MNTVLETLEKLCVESEKHARTLNWKAAELFFAETEQKWNSLDPENRHAELRKRFTDSYSLFNTRYSSDKIRKTRIAEREALCEEIEKHSLAHNAADFTERVKEIANIWKGLPPIPEEYLEILQKRFEKAYHGFLKHIETFRKEQSLRNEKLPEIELLCGKVEQLSDGTMYWHQAEKELKKLKEKWSSIVSETHGIDDFKERFNSAVENFKNRKNECLNILSSEISLLNELCRKLELCLEAENLKSVLPNVKEIKSLWRVSNIKDPEKEKIQRHFKSLLQSYHRKINEIFEEEEWERWENYTIKLGLCEKAESLLKESNFHLRYKRLRELQEEWKWIGSIPKDKSQEVWEHFHSICEKVYQTCREFFDEQNKRCAENLLKKESLCERAEAIGDSEEWEDTAEKYKELQAEWNSIDPAQREKEKEIFQRFRKACGDFFEKRKLHYMKLHEVWAENKKYKISLCEQAEALIERNDLKNSFYTASELRDKWRDAASSGRKNDQHLWKRFSLALKNFYEKLDAVRLENLSKKEKICLNLESLMASPELKINCEKIEVIFRNSRDEWKAIGPVPKEEEKKIGDRFFSLLRSFDEKYREFRRELQSVFEKNINLKEKILDKITDISGSIDNNVEEFISTLLNEWDSTNPVPEEKKQELNQRFNDAISSLKNRNHDYFISIKKQYNENLKLKKELCVQIEQLSGTAVLNENDQGNGFSDDLANELKFAIENNFALANERRKNNINEIFDKFENIKHQWGKIGRIPSEEREKIERRFHNACESFRDKYQKY